jgi:lipopolysaccharide/colanic/teichoic acid biosynthesis glycosyltransferase
VTSDPIPYPRAKWIFDRVLSGLLVLLLLPLYVILAVAITTDAIVSARDRGGVFYREPRISRGEPFELLKFRTLRAGVVRQVRARDDHASPYERESANLTWAGRRLLKPRYLDELPQLLNVLRGDISFVGPRPWPPAMVAKQSSDGLDYRDRIVAGLTGPAQITKGGGLPYAELDLAYVETCRTLGGWSLVRYDLGIIRRTLSVLVRGEGLSY